MTRQGPLNALLLAGRRWDALCGRRAHPPHSGAPGCRTV